MTIIKKGVLVSLMLLAGCSSSNSSVSQPQTGKTLATLNNAEVNALYVGKTIRGDLRGHPIRVKFDAAGKVESDYDDESDEGTYTIKDGVLCISFNQWKRWVNPRGNCGTTSKNGSGYIFKNIKKGDVVNFTVVQ